MAIDFPSSPSVSQQYTYGGITYEWDGEKWVIYLSTLKWFVSSSPPSNPEVGWGWYDLDSGSFYLYVNDGSSSQWVPTGPAGQSLVDALTSSDIGVSVQGYDADTLKGDVEDQGPLTGGVKVTVKDLSTVSSGTVTPDPGDRPMQKYTNGGAHTLAPHGSNYGNYILEITNNASAGTITTTGWDVVAGDSFDTTNGNKFVCQCIVTADNSLLIVTAMQ
jgi:hypothetical protein